MQAIQRDLGGGAAVRRDRISRKERDSRKVRKDKKTRLSRKVMSKGKGKEAPSKVKQKKRAQKAGRLHAFRTSARTSQRFVDETYSQGRPRGDKLFCLVRADGSEGSRVQRRPSRGDPPPAQSPKQREIGER